MAIERNAACFRHVGIACLAAVLSSACGLRSDSDYNPLCVGAGGGGDESGESGGDDAACADPIVLPFTGAEPFIVSGIVGGCSSSEGYCGGTGGEDVFVFEPPADGDVRLTFDPAGTDFTPVIRVVHGDPCGDSAISDTEVCAEVTNELPGRNFRFDSAKGPAYIIVDAALGEGGNYEFEVAYGAIDYPETCLEHLEEQEIVLGVGGNFQWNGTVDDGQGIMDGACGGQGGEDIFRVTLNQAGTLSVNATAASGGWEPILGLRPDGKCHSHTEIACGSSAVTTPLAIGSYLLTIDNDGATAGEYELSVSLD